jgi:hypothetical protein
MPGMVTGMDPGFETRHALVVPLDIDTSSEHRTGTSRAAHVHLPIQHGGITQVVKSRAIVDLSVKVKS